VSNLWLKNTPTDFWKLGTEFCAEDWEAAVRRAYPTLGSSEEFSSTPALLEAVLGEGQFGSKRWQLSTLKKLYYQLKPIVPRSFVRTLRSYGINDNHRYPLGFPVEDRYVRFLWEVVRQLLLAKGLKSVDFAPFWPQGKQFAFGLRHDIEEHTGYDFVRELASIDQRHGFRSVFNFVARRYPVDPRLISELQEAGHEVGVHGLYHDGKDFFSERHFMKRAPYVNSKLKEWDSATYCAPLTHRNPYWLQALDIEYDQSFFDTDPHEPMIGGVMTIFPFFVGKFVEIPYTLVQDHTLKMLMNETTPRLWLEKVAFIEQYHGMVMVNTHPDYLLNTRLMQIYTEFLCAMQSKSNTWHATPGKIARWWKARHEQSVEQAEALQTLTLVNGALQVTAKARASVAKPEVASVG
jgi:peptidoglycan/xylan/chitin deacetylase (PgdA/CDA1 family)